MNENYQETITQTADNLSACIICQNDRWKILAELIRSKFNQIFVVLSPNTFGLFLPNYPANEHKLENLDTLPNHITVAFCHESDQHYLNDINTQFQYFFKFTTSGNPEIKDQKEIPIYRKNEPGKLGIKANDIEEVFAYITGQRQELPSMCSPVIYIEPNSEVKTSSHLESFLKKLEENLKERTSLEEDLYDSIYQLAGHPKAIVYVLDDYNNYILKENNIYKPNLSIIESIASYYCTDSKQPIQEFQEILLGFCLMLNNLSLAFTVKAPKLTIAYNESNSKLINSALPLAEISKDYSQIVAFIIDLEWLPHPSQDNSHHSSEKKSQQNWKKMGCHAIDILSQLYSEIPSFIFTGLQPSEEVQEALAHGASWGFYKEKTHHYSSEKETSQQLTGQLNYVNLKHHLTRVVNVRYGSYQAVPFPNKLQLDPVTATRRHLLEKLGISNFNKEQFQINLLEQLIAGLLPTADFVEPIKVLTSGKSKAQATFLVTPILKKDQLATRFIKIGSWFSIQKEYLAYKNVIQPRLNSYTANIIQKPILAEKHPKQMPWSALMYSLAGFPEDYHNLKSLHELFEESIELLSENSLLVERVKNTLDKVLFPLYQSSLAKSKTEKSLGYWLGDILPPLYTGILIPLPLTHIKLLAEAKDPITLLSPSLQTNNENSRELVTLDFCNLDEQLKQQEKDCQENNIYELSPSDKSLFEKPYKIIFLSNWKLSLIEWEDNPEGDGSVVLVHPSLGIRVLLRGKSEDIRLRFGATWLRPGISTQVAVCLDSQNQEFERISNQIRKNCSKFISTSQIETSSSLNKFEILLKDFQKSNQLKTQDFISPFKFFREFSCLCANSSHSLLEAHSGPTHGDLNLNNILYTEQETVGWLIDFERVQPQGMIAFDLAKLEVEIWNHHLSPYLAALANLNSCNYNHICYQLLYGSLQALEFPGDEAEFFLTKIKRIEGFAGSSDSLLSPITNFLKVIKIIRRFGLEKCQLSSKEIKWALSAYFFNSAKFSCQNKKLQATGGYAAVFAFLASAWYLSTVLGAAEST